MKFSTNEILALVGIVFMIGGSILGFYVWVKVKFAEIEVKIANMEKQRDEDTKDTTLLRSELTAQLNTVQNDIKSILQILGSK